MLCCSVHNLLCLSVCSQAGPAVHLGHSLRNHNPAFNLLTWVSLFLFGQADGNKHNDLITAHGHWPADLQPLDQSHFALMTYSSKRLLWLAEGAGLKDAPLLWWALIGSEKEKVVCVWDGELRLRIWELVFLAFVETTHNLWITHAGVRTHKHNKNRKELSFKDKSFPKNTLLKF